MKQRSRGKRGWKKIVSNLLILGGLLVIAYPAGTWGITWWEQRALERELLEAAPGLDESPAELLQTGMVVVDKFDQDEKQQVLDAAREAERRAVMEDLARRAQEFAESSNGKGGTPLGRLVIPKIGVDVIVIEGTGRGDLREGPGHWPETPLPGASGNFVISGHRTTYGAPFFNLDKLEPGDTIEFAAPYAVFRYKITRVVIVLPHEVDTVKQRGVEEISLATCHPIYSAEQRLVVQAEIEGFKILDGGVAVSGL
ncbi:MAG: class E sortase [Actinobacteria bacterium]|nr:class E sortase [Actinomycetota bacterium]